MGRGWDHGSSSPCRWRRRPLRAGRARRPRATVRQGRVLVVDDDPQVLWHVRGALTEAGYAPLVTWDPEEVERLIVVRAAPLGAPRPGSAGVRRGGGCWSASCS